MKKIFLLILIIILGVSIINFSSSLKYTEANVLTLNDISGLAICKMIIEEDNISKGYKTTYDIENNADEIEQILYKGDKDIAIIPTELAAKVYNQNSDYKTNYEIFASIGKSANYLVTSNMKVTGFNSTLANKKIGVVNKDSLTAILAKAMLKANGVKKSSIEFEYFDTAPELVTALTSGEVETGIVPETSLTNLLYKYTGLKIISSTNEAYDKAFNVKGGYYQYSIVVRRDFASENQDYVEEFLSKVKESINFINENPLQAGAYAEKVKLPVKPQLLSRAVERCNLKYKSIKKIKDNYRNLFNILYKYDKESIGGIVPDEPIFYHGY